MACTLRLTRDLALKATKNRPGESLPEGTLVVLKDNSTITLPDERVVRINARTLYQWAEVLHAGEAYPIDAAPSDEALEEYVFDSVCPSITGDTVEPDGHGPDGAPSWLLLLGFV
jgi:hypothetical protein